MVVLPKLTARQEQVYLYIQDRIREWGYPPTIREIGEHLGIRSTNGVADHLKALKRKGYLTQEGMKSRTLRPTQATGIAAADPNVQQERRGDEAIPTLVGRSGGRSGGRYGGTRGGRYGATVEIPILGRVAAGEPLLAEEQAEGCVVIDSMLVGEGRKVFALKVVGESMIEAGIFDGDFIFVQKRPTADPGEIVVVVIENESTVKYFFPEEDRIRLQPANASMRPIYVSRDAFRQIQIIGVVVGVYRRLSR